MGIKFNTLKRYSFESDALADGFMLATNVLFVSTQGSDSTGEKGNFFKPYQTIEGALNAAVSGDVVAIWPGTYAETTNLFKEGVFLYTICGTVVITKNNDGPVFLFDSSGQDWEMIGDFVITKTTGNGSVFNFSGITGRKITIDISQATNDNGPVLAIDNGSVDGNSYFISGKFISTNTYAMYIFPHNSSYWNVRGYLEGIGYAVLYNGIIGAKMDMYADIVGNVYTVGLSCTSVWYGTITGDFECYQGSVTVNGTIVGDVINETAIQVNYTNNFVLNGILTGSGNFINQNGGIGTINGIVYGSLIIDSGYVIYNSGNNYTQGSADFYVTGGVLVYRNTIARNSVGNLTGSSVDGGTVILENDIFINKKPLTNGNLIVMNSGQLVLKCNFYSIGTSDFGYQLPALVQMEGGELVADGFKAYCEDPDANPIVFPTAQNIYLQQGGTSTNINFMLAKKQKEIIQITNAVVGYTYTFGAANYIAVPGDTVITIAANLVALIADPNVVITDNLDGTFDAEASVAGTGFTDTISLLNMEKNIVRQNSVAPTDVITGTAQNTRYLFDLNVK